jgi:hypothetical protein
MAAAVHELVARYSVSRVVAERQSVHAATVGALGLRIEELSLFEVKALLLPLAGPRTNRALFQAVMAEQSQLRRYGTADADGRVLSLGEPDRWRTVVLLAAAFVLAAKWRIQSN